MMMNEAEGSNSYMVSRSQSGCRIITMIMPACLQIRSSVRSFRAARAKKDGRAREIIETENVEMMYLRACVSGNHPSSIIAIYRIDQLA